jgi:hypothetical protein
MTSARPHPPVAPHGSVTGRRGDARERTRAAGAARRPDGGRVQSVTVRAGLQDVPLAKARGFAGQDGQASAVGMRIGWGMHDQAPKRLRRGLRASPLCHWPESFVVTPSAAATFTMGGSGMLHFSECCATKRSWVPESFRGSCSFGGQRAGSLPLIAKLNLAWFVAELCCSGHAIFPARDTAAWRTPRGAQRTARWSIMRRFGS